MNSERINSLLEQYRPGYGLPAGFYTDPDVWAADIEMLTPHWYIVGHSSQIPDPGDTKVVSLLGESVIVVRGSDGAIRAFYNVCSHRGARLCDESAEGLRQFTCPYHNWSYSLEGKIKSRRLEVVFDETFDPEAHNLRPCHLRVFAGLIFVSLSDAPTDFDAAYQPFEDVFRFYGIADTKVIRVHGFGATANWKTLVENTIDPYHVPVVHPNFTRTRTPAYWQAAAATRHAEVTAAADQAEREMDEWEAALTQLPDATGVIVQDGEHDEQFRWLVRGPLAPGYESETIGGKRVAPLMGRFTESDGASVFSNFNPLDSLFMSPDHATIFNIRPLAHDRIYWDTMWLVDKDAEEGRDYDVDEVCEFYTEVNEEDFPIWEWTYQGATSRAYRPGRLAPQESFIGEFQRWYVRRLRQQVETPATLSV